MSIVTHSAWKQLKPYLVVEVYARDGTNKNPRVRIELKRLPPKLHTRALKLTMSCVSCGRGIHPIRQRNARNKRSDVVGQNLYYAATCPLDVSIGCSRGAAARDEYLVIKKALRPDL